LIVSLIAIPIGVLIGNIIAWGLIKYITFKIEKSK